jgi:23S rRNA (uridine2552-2'-O)-methyltransferase
VVVSDMAPNTTGIKSVDQIKSLELVQKVIDILPKILKENGNFVIKVFESQEAQDYFKSIKDIFQKISFLRPKSTRSVSKEYFVIGEGYKKK